MIEFFIDLNVGHESIKTSGDWRPLGVFFSDTFFSIDFHVNLLIFSQFGDQYIWMLDLNIFNFMMIL